MRLSLYSLLAILLLLPACPHSGAPSPATAQAALAPRAAQLPSGWPIGALKPSGNLQQVKFTPQVLAAIEARAGSRPTVSADGYEITGLPYKEMQEDDALAGSSGQATSTDAPDATDRARPRR